MRHINSLFKEADVIEKKLHAITDDAKHMQNQFKLEQAEEAKEVARLADVADKVKHLEVARNNKKRALELSDSNLTFINNCDVINMQPENSKQREGSTMFPVKII
jgi:hypothetical protein